MLTGGYGGAVVDFVRKTLGRSDADRAFRSGLICIGAGVSEWPDIMDPSDRPDDIPYKSEVIEIVNRESQFWTRRELRLVLECFYRDETQADVARKEDVSRMSMSNVKTRVIGRIRKALQAAEAYSAPITESSE